MSRELHRHFSARPADRYPHGRGRRAFLALLLASLFLLVVTGPEGLVLRAIEEVPLPLARSTVPAQPSATQAGAAGSTKPPAQQAAAQPSAAAGATPSAGGAAGTGAAGTGPNYQAVLNAATPTSPCVMDWRQCTSQRDMVENYRQMTQLYRACEDALRSQSRLGPPFFNNAIPFREYDRRGNTPETGIIVLRERRVGMVDEWGARGEMDAECEVDLNQQAIIRLEVTPSGRR